MRVILDFQTSQSGSRYRGIGRGSRGLMLAMARRLHARDHQVICLLSNAFPDDIDELQCDILSHAPGVFLSKFTIPIPCAAFDHRNSWRQLAARLLRELAIASFEPDFVHVPALLADGWGDDSVASVGELGVHVPVSLTQHDLIPLVMKETYMPPGPFCDYYFKKLDGVKKADLFLAISEYSRQEVIQLLDVPPERVLNISSAVDDQFLHITPSNEAIGAALKRFGLEPGFLLYVPGGFDPRKNLERLFRAYASLSPELRSHHPLVIGSKLDPGREEVLRSYALEAGVGPDELILTDYVSDEELISLYRACFAYVFPSLHEGFGLPALEAMASGAPVIASDCTSIPEVIGMQEALFDPYNVESIAKKLRQVIEDPLFRRRLIDHAALQPGEFSWGKSAEVAVNAMEERHDQLLSEGWQPILKKDLPTCDALLDKLAQEDVQVPSEEDLAAFRACYVANYAAVMA